MDSSGYLQTSKVSCYPHLQTCPWMEGSNCSDLRVNEEAVLEVLLVFCYRMNVGVSQVLMLAVAKLVYDASFKYYKFGSQV